MSQERRCIRITGTSTGKLRAKVETTKQEHVGLGHYEFTTERFEVTIGGTKWQALEPELREAIILRAQRYANHLVVQCNEHTLALIMSRPSSDQQGETS